MTGSMTVYVDGRQVKDTGKGDQIRGFIEQALETRRQGERHP